MRKLLLYFLLLLLGWSTELQAHMGDSLRYLLPTDTVLIRGGNASEKVFYHTMENGQTLYSLANFYGFTIPELYAYNPEIDPARGVSPGGKVRISLPNRAIIRYHVPGVLSRSECASVYYEVRSGDTMFGIAKRLFDMSIDTLVQRNGLTSTVISPGELLHIGWMKTDGVPMSWRKSTSSKVWQTSQRNYYRYVEQTYHRREHKERGKAVWNKSEGSKNGGDRLMAMHRSAKLNSYIAVTNPMTKRVVYAKVIGRIPAGAYGNEVKVILSPEAARTLGARDPRFYVEISYVK